MKAADTPGDTPQVTLRALEPGDADFLYEVENDALAWSYSETVAPLSRRILRDYALNYDANPFGAGQIRLVIKESGPGRPVGIADLYGISAVNRNAWVGIYILPGQRRRGYASAALARLARYAFGTLRLHRIGAKVAALNTPSAQLFGSNGFMPVATVPQWIALGDDRFDDMIVYILKCPHGTMNQIS